VRWTCRKCANGPQAGHEGDERAQRHVRDPHAAAGAVGESMILVPGRVTQPASFSKLASRATSASELLAGDRPKHARTEGPNIMPPRNRRARHRLFRAPGSVRKTVPVRRRDHQFGGAGFCGAPRSRSKARARPVGASARANGRRNGSTSGPHLVRRSRRSRNCGARLEIAAAGLYLSSSGFENCIWPARPSRIAAQVEACAAQGHSAARPPTSGRPRSTRRSWMRCCA